MKTSSVAPLTCLLASVGALLLLPAAAHHASTMYDQQQDIELQGELVEVRFANPHVLFTVRVLDQSARNGTWLIETAPPAALQSSVGIEASTYKAGDCVKIAGHPTRTASNRLLLTNILGPDGTERVVSNLGGAPKPRWSKQVVASNPFKIVEGVKSAEAAQRGIFRTWVWVAPTDVETWGRENAARFSLNERGQRLRAAALDAQKMTTTGVLNNCPAYGMPTIQYLAYPQFEFVNQGDAVLVRIQLGNNVRMIYMNGGAPTPMAAPSRLGNSVGRWEGKTLVVQTRDIDFPYMFRGVQLEMPQSPRITLVERFTPNDDGSRLDYEVTITDPEYLTKPAVLNSYFVWRPEAKVEEYKCAEAQ